MEYKPVHNSARMKRLTACAVLAAGFSGLAAQLLLLRELLVVFSGSELSIGIILANWLMLEAFGCFLAGRKAGKVKNSFAAFAGITAFFSLYLPAAVYLARVLRNILGIAVAGGVGLLPMMYSSFLILLPASVCHGALFAFGCRLYSEYSGREESAAGRVYFYEVAGTILGGIAWTYLLIPRLHAFQTAAALGLLNLLVCVLLLAPGRSAGRLAKAGAVISSLLLLSGVYAVSAGWPLRLHEMSVNARWKGQNVVHYENSVYGNISVIESGGQYIFFRDGVPAVSTPVPDIAGVERFVHLPLLSHPRPEKLMVLGGGAGGVINEILKHSSVNKVEYAELDPLFIELIRKFPTRLSEKELTDDRVNIARIDGRLFLQTAEGGYDIILVGVGEPSNLQANRFFTEEFFSLAKQKLAGDGILVFGLPGSLAHLNYELKNLNSSIYRTVSRVFPYVRVIPGEGRNLFLSSASPEVSLMDAARLSDRLRERGLEEEGVIPWHIERKLHASWEGWFSELIEGGAERINRDFAPAGVFYSAARRSAVFEPYLRVVFRQFERINLGLFAAVLAAASVFSFFLRTRRKSFHGGGIPLSAATTGFAGMIFDLALIFTFQSMYGYVFSWIGLLITSFMAGAACGAIVSTKFLTGIKNSLKLFMKVEGAIIFFSFVLPFIFLLLRRHTGADGPFDSLRVFFLVLLFLSGLLVGAQFPLANKIYLSRGADLSGTAGLLYGADLMGGWLGGIAGGVVLLPVLGLFGACMAVVLLKLSSFVIILSGYYRKER